MELKVGDWIRIKASHFHEPLHGSIRQVRRVSRARGGAVWVDDVEAGRYWRGGICVSPEHAELLPRTTDRRKDSVQVGDIVQSHISDNGLSCDQLYEVVRINKSNNGVYILDDDGDRNYLSPSEWSFSPLNSNKIYEDMKRAVESVKDNPDIREWRDCPHPHFGCPLDASSLPVEEIPAEVTDGTAYREPKDGKGVQHLLRVGFPHTLNELAKHMECDLGKERNWEKGLPLSSFADAQDRHWTEHLSGNDSTGKALVSVLWNLMCYSETLHRVETGALPSELDDIDRTKRSEIVYNTEG